VLQKTPAAAFAKNSSVAKSVYKSQYSRRPANYAFHYNLLKLLDRPAIPEFRNLISGVSGEAEKEGQISQIPYRRRLKLSLLLQKNVLFSFQKTVKKKIIGEEGNVNGPVS
jgi:hypothetical protein